MLWIKIRNFQNKCDSHLHSAYSGSRSETFRTSAIFYSPCPSPACFSYPGTREIVVVVRVPRANSPISSRDGFGPRSLSPAGLKGLHRTATTTLLMTAGPVLIQGTDGRAGRPSLDGVFFDRPVDRSFAGRGEARGDFSGACGSFTPSILCSGILTAAPAPKTNEPSMFR